MVNREIVSRESSNGESSVTVVRGNREFYKKRFSTNYTECFALGTERNPLPSASVLLKFHQLSRGNHPALKGRYTTARGEQPLRSPGNERRTINRALKRCDRFRARIQMNAHDEYVRVLKKKQMIHSAVREPYFAPSGLRFGDHLIPGLEAKLRHPGLVYGALPGLAAKWISPNNTKSSVVNG